MQGIHKHQMYNLCTTILIMILTIYHEPVERKKKKFQVKENNDIFDQLKKSTDAFTQLFSQEIDMNTLLQKSDSVKFKQNYIQWPH